MGPLCRQKDLQGLKPDLFVGFIGTTEVVP
jgi:hypothetical protein